MRHLGPVETASAILRKTSAAASGFRSFLPLMMTVMSGVLLFAMLVGAGRAEASKYASIVMEEANGRVLFSRNADSLRYPASLTKIMTLYLLFEDIEAGKISLKSRIEVSKRAAGRSPVKTLSKTRPIDQCRAGDLCAGYQISQ